MKREIVGLFMMLFLSSFVFAVGSEVAIDFVVDSHKPEVGTYVPPKSFVGDYLGYLVLIVVALVFVYFVFSNKKTSKRRVHKKRKTSKRSRKKK